MSNAFVNDFPLLDEFTSIRLGVNPKNLRSQKILIIESTRRLRRERSHGFIHLIWWLYFGEFSTVISVPHGFKKKVESALKEFIAESLPDKALASNIAERLKNTITLPTGVVVGSYHYSEVFACNQSYLKLTHSFLPAQRLGHSEHQIAEGIHFPTHCFPEGIVYGIVQNGKVVSVAYAYKTGIMEDKVADLAVETGVEYRNRGYGKAVVSAVVRHICEKGGEARYACSPKNFASIATALSVGFVPYCKSFILTGSITELDE